MVWNPLKPDIRDLPADLPIFPLSGVLLLPRGQLPLNIFEPRYLAMVTDALASPDRMIGMVQPRQSCDCADDDTEIFPVGCAGRISSFEETADGRMLITLTGVSRFRVAEEHALAGGGYRHVRTDWSGFDGDLVAPEDGSIPRNSLMPLLKAYMNEQGLSCSWAAVETAPDEKLITCLSMICPFESDEKQMLLEAKTLCDRAKILESLLQASLRNNGETGSGCCH